MICYMKQYIVRNKKLIEKNKIISWKIKSKLSLRQKTVKE